jgi:dTDP-4-amino-4,6-dideoxygalactose transaminase
MMVPSQETVRLVDLRGQREQLEPALSAAMARVVDESDFILGREVEEFEQAFAAYCGTAYAVGVDSGLSALELGLRGAGLVPGDEVITSANTFMATVGAMMAIGAKPVLCDCDETGAPDPAAMAACVTERTRAIVPVHLFGRVADMDGILDVANRAGAIVVEDAAQAHGAQLGGRKTGGFGAAGAFSFYPTKNLGAFGDAGMLVTGSADLAAAARSMRNYGQRSKHDHAMFPLNRRLDTIQAAVLRVKLPHLDKWNRRRQELADDYRCRLEGVPVGVPAAEVPDRHVYHLFVLQTADRDPLRRSLAAEGIETGIHYPTALHQQPVLQHLGYRTGQFPNAERLAGTSLSLPMYPELEPADLDRVTAAVGRHLHA